MVHMNVFRILGDLSHTLSKCILIWAIHWNRSAEGVSLITQVLYAFVFVTRYLDLFWFWKWDFSDEPWLWYWNFSLKNFYIWSSVYIILVMRLYARTREREKAWKFGAICFGGSLVLAPLVTLIFLRKKTTLTDVIWSFSQILESVCVLPQLLLLRQTSVPTVIDSYYLVTLGSYRAFYVLNWIVRATDKNDIPLLIHPIAVIFGVVQTLLYLDFAWVYWSRQRVKLRAGGVVDSDDFRNSWLLRMIFGQRTTGGLNDNVDDDHDDHVEDGLENGNATHPRRKGRGRWGARGVSISADDDAVVSGEPPLKKKGNAKEDEDEDAELVGVGEEDDEEEIEREGYRDVR